MMTRSNRLAALVASAMLVALPVTPAAAQTLPLPPPGTVGDVLSPLEDLVSEITGPLGDLACQLNGDEGVPLDNAITLCGEDAVDAAIALSRITFQDGSSHAFIGRDDVFADTLSSVAGQGLAGAPLLLTQTGAIDDRTSAALDELGVTRVTILGSVLAIDETVEAQLVQRYGADNVERFGGPSRIETAADLAAGLAPQADHVALMRAYPAAGADQSQAYADALSAGPFASSLGIPSLLTTTDYLHPATLAYLQSADVSTVTIIGGELAIGAAVEQALLDMGITVNRVSGVNRWDTSIKIANQMDIFDASDANRLILTQGGSDDRPLWAAGFAAAAHGAVYQSPVILADGPLLPPETLSFIADGVLSNALRLSNQPVVCNSFVDFLACETVALMMVGSLDEANQLTGGGLEAALGPVFEQIRSLVEQILPGAGEAGPGLVGQVLGLLGVTGNEEAPDSDLCSDGIDNDEDGTIDESDECAAAFAAAGSSTAEQQLQAALSTLPTDVQDAVIRLVGPAGDRVSPSTQGVITTVLTAVNAALDGSTVDAADDEQGAALIDLLDAITAGVEDRASATTIVAGLDPAIAALVAAIAVDAVGGILDPIL